MAAPSGLPFYLRSALPRSPLQAERSGDGKGEAQRRAAQAEHSAARKPGETRRAREGRPC
jgi:hypothetical protein